jgi:hypothetical protein
LLREGLDSSNSGSGASVRVADAVVLLTGERVAALGLAETVGSVGERVNEAFDVSRFRARTVDPGADPRTGFRLVVVFDLATPLRERTESETKTLVRRSGEDVGEGSFVVVKNPKTLSATILILALARL